MANTLTDIIPKLLARGLIVLRETAIMPRLVNSDYGTDAAKKGATIDVPIPTATTASAVTPSQVPPAPTSLIQATVPIVMDQWYKSDFHLTDKEMMEIDRNESFMPQQSGEAVRAIANVINAHILGKYVGIYGFASSTIDDAPHVDPFVAAANLDDATTLRKELNLQLAPKSDRRVVLDWNAEANALALEPFRDASASSDRGVIIEGEIGRKFGMEWFADDQVPLHTAGTASVDTDAIAVDNGAGYAAGIKSMNVDVAAATSTFVIGDIFQLAGHTGSYTATNAGTFDVTGVTLTFEPGLREAVVDDEALNFETTHTVNLAFHRDAFALAMRPLQSNTDVTLAGGMIMSLQDPVTGLILRLEVSRQYKQVVWEFDALWGAELVRPALAARLPGAP